MPMKTRPVSPIVVKFVVLVLPFILQKCLRQYINMNIYCNNDKALFGYLYWRLNTTTKVCLLVANFIQFRK